MFTLFLKFFLQISYNEFQTLETLMHTYIYAFQFHACLISKQSISLLLI